MRYLLLLRHNIPLPGDLRLAQQEIEAIFGRAPEPVEDLSAWLAAHPVGGEALPAGPQRVESPCAFTLEAPPERLPGALRRLTFCRALIASGSPDELDQAQASLPAPFALTTRRRAMAVIGVPTYALMEASEALARRAEAGEAVVQALEDLPAFVLDGAPSRYARLIQAGLWQQGTTGHLTHGIHRYKAKFFPRLVRSLLNQALGPERGDRPALVADPFAGSGTLLLEAALLGLPSFGLDLDPISTRIARAKVESLRASPQDFDGIAGLVADAVSWPVAVDSSLRFPPWLERKLSPADLAANLADIQCARTALARAPDRLRPWMEVALSDAISRKFRMRFLGTGVGRFALELSQAAIPEMMVENLQRWGRAVAAFRWFEERLGVPLAPATLRQGDARQFDCFTGEGRCDIVITSPPYLPASSGRESYARSKAPAMIALNLADALEVDSLAQASLGSMAPDEPDLASLTQAERALVEWLAQDELRRIKAAPTARYFQDMRQVLGAIRRALRPEGIAYLIVGKQSTFYRFSTREVLYTVPVAEWIARSAESAGLRAADQIDVQLFKSNRNARPRSLDAYYETVLALKHPA